MDPRSLTRLGSLALLLVATTWSAGAQEHRAERNDDGGNRHGYAEERNDDLPPPRTYRTRRNDEARHERGQATREPSVMQLVAATVPAQDAPIAQPERRTRMIEQSRAERVAPAWPAVHRELAPVQQVDADERSARERVGTASRERPAQRDDNRDIRGPQRVHTQGRPWAGLPPGADVLQDRRVREQRERELRARHDRDDDDDRRDDDRDDRVGQRNERGETQFRPDRGHDRDSDDRRRLSDAERERRIREERARSVQYQRTLAARQSAERQRYVALQQQQRLQQYRYQQDYYRRLYAEQARWNGGRYSFDRDPYYYTPATYRYYRDGRYHQINRYAADLLQQAIRYGYQEGYRAGRADEMDGWRFDYRSTYAYQDANYGYYGYYVNPGEYQHYFRQGFRRGYEDGYRRDARYGRRVDGNYLILQSVLGSILDLQRY